jgi:hypothetical protein
LDRWSCWGINYRPRLASNRDVHFIPETDVDRKNGAIQQFPQWYREGKPISGKRSTFSSWELYNKEDKLLPSGMLGPVVVEYYPVDVQARRNISKCLPN